MKKKRIILIVIAFILLLTLCFAKTFAEALGLWYSHEDWHEKEIENTGTVMIPNEWHTEAFDDGIAILDYNDNLCMIGLYGSAYKYKDILVSCGETVSSTVLSNSAYYGVKKGQIGDQNRNILFLSFYRSPKESGTITFYVYDESIGTETVKQIAASFKTD